MSVAAHRAAGERAVAWARHALAALVSVWALAVALVAVLAASTPVADLRGLVLHTRRSEAMVEVMAPRDDVVVLVACVLAVPVALAAVGDALTRWRFAGLREDVRQRVSPLSVGAVGVALVLGPSVLGSIAVSATIPQGGGLLSLVGFWPYVAVVAVLVVVHHAESAPDAVRAAALQPTDSGQGRRARRGDRRVETGADGSAWTRAPRLR